jgi:hypothetical protein
MAAEILLWAAYTASLSARAVPWRGELRRRRTPPTWASVPSVVPSSISASATANRRGPGLADRRIPRVRTGFGACTGIGDAAPQFTA